MHRISFFLDSVDTACGEKLRTSDFTIAQETVPRFSREVFLNAGIKTGALPDPVEPVRDIGQAVPPHRIHVQHVQAVHIGHDPDIGEGERLSRQPGAIGQRSFHLFQRLGTAS